MNEVPARPLPQARGHWLLGSALALAAAPHEFVAALPDRDAGLAAFRILHRPFAAVAHPDAVRQIMVTNHQRYRRSFHYDNPVVGKGLLSTDGEVWRKRRRQVQPAFRRETMAHLVRMANLTADRLFASWDAAVAQGQTLELLSEMQKLALSVNSQALLSVEVGWSTAEQFGVAVRSALRLLRRRNTSLLRLPPWLPTPLNRSLDHTRAILDDYLQPLISARRAAPGDHQDILAALLEVRDPETGDALADQEILDETKTLFTAGFETTATALSWAVYLLARHPAETALWQLELDTVLAGRAPQWEDLPRLPRTARIIDETLRLYPPVYNVARECIETDVVMGYRIPRGTVVLMSVLGIQRDARWWPEPERFHPDRFADAWPRHAYLPFATGRHLCIGNNFALTEMAVALARIGQRYDIELLDREPVGTLAQITLVPDRALPFRLVRR